MKRLVTQELVEDEMDQRLHRLDGDLSGAVKDDVGFVTVLMKASDEMLEKCSENIAVQYCTMILEFLHVLVIFPR